MLNSFKKWIQTTVELPLNDTNSLLDGFKDTSTSQTKKPTNFNAMTGTQPVHAFGNVNQRPSNSALNQSIAPVFATKDASSSSRLSPGKTQRAPAKLDLSHLNAEEQAHIADVLERAKIEEYKIDERKKDRPSDNRTVSQSLTKETVGIKNQRQETQNIQISSRQIAKSSPSSPVKTTEFVQTSPIDMSLNQPGTNNRPSPRAKQEVLKQSSHSTNNDSQRKHKDVSSIAIVKDHSNNQAYAKSKTAKNYDEYYPTSEFTQLDTQATSNSTVNTWPQDKMPKSRSADGKANTIKTIDKPVEDDSFISYANKEIENLERTLNNKTMTANMGLARNHGTNRTHSQICISVISDSDDDCDNIFVCDLSQQTQSKNTHIMSASKFATKCIQQQQQRSNSTEPKMTEAKSKRRLPSAPSDVDLASEADQSESVQTRASPNPKLENVEEWLSRSFDRDSAKKSIVLQQQQHISRQQSEDSTVSDELVEINVKNRAQTTQHKQQIKPNGLLCVPTQVNGRLGDSKSSNTSTVTLVASNSQEIIKENKKADRRASPLPYRSNESTSTAPSSSFKHICLYKNPRDSIDSLGIKIAARQRVSDLDKDLATLVKHIIPNGIVQLFELPIDVGDEIVEINGVCLRNKTNDEIVDILNRNCELNNGEIELALRTPDRRSCFGNSNTSHELTDEQLSNGSSVEHFSSSVKSSSLASSPVYSDLVTMSTNRKHYLSQSSSNIPRANQTLLNNTLSRVNKQTCATSRTQTTNNKTTSLIKTSNNNQELSTMTDQNARTLKLPLVKAGKQQSQTSPQDYEENIFVSNTDDRKPISGANSRPHSRSPSPSPYHQQPKAGKSLNDRDTSKLPSQSPYDPKLMHLNSVVDSFSGADDLESGNRVLMKTIKADKTHAGLNDLSCMESVDTDNENFSKYFQNSTIMEANRGRNPSKTSIESDRAFASTGRTDDPIITTITDTSNTDKKLKPKLSFRFQSSKKFDLQGRKNSIPIEMPYGEIELQIGHDAINEQINVKIIRARNLQPKDANGFSDPFVKLYLLPGRDQDNKRRTKPVFKNLNPEWNYQVVYPHVHKEELKYKTLEVTVWDYDRFKSNDFLGKVEIDLSNPKHVNNKPIWYQLKSATHRSNDDGPDYMSES